MAVDGTDLISPVGEIDPSLFPDDGENELPERLDGYLLEAEGKDATASDDAKRAWAYHRSFRAVFIRLSSTPGAALDDQGNIKYSDAQIQNFSTLSEKYLKEWEEATNTLDISTRNLGITGSVDNKFVY